MPDEHSDPAKRGGCVHTNAADDPPTAKKRTAFCTAGWWLLPGLVLGALLWWLGLRAVLRLFAG